MSASSSPSQSETAHSFALHSVADVDRLTTDAQISGKPIQSLQISSKIALLKFCSLPSAFVDAFCSSALTQLHLKAFVPGVGLRIREPFGHEGMRALMHCFQYLSSLQQLNLSLNRLGAEGAMALASLASSLQHLSSLQQLDLNGNGINAERAIALASSFRHFAISLQQLNFSSRS